MKFIEICRYVSRLNATITACL